MNPFEPDQGPEVSGETCQSARTGAVEPGENNESIMDLGTRGEIIKSLPAWQVVWLRSVQKPINQLKGFCKNKVENLCFMKVGISMQQDARECEERKWELEKNSFRTVGWDVRTFHIFCCIHISIPLLDHLIQRSNDNRWEHWTTLRLTDKRMRNALLPKQSFTNLFLPPQPYPPSMWLFQIFV